MYLISAMQDHGGKQTHTNDGNVSEEVEQTPTQDPDQSPVSAHVRVPLQVMLVCCKPQKDALNNLVLKSHNTRDRVTYI